MCQGGGGRVNVGLRSRLTPRLYSEGRSGFIQDDGLGGAGRYYEESQGERRDLGGSSLGTEEEGVRTRRRPTVGPLGRSPGRR